MPKNHSLIKISVCLLTVFIYGAQLQAQSTGTIIVGKIIRTTPAAPVADNLKTFGFTRNYAPSPFFLGNHDFDAKTSVPPGLHRITESQTLQYKTANIECKLSQASTSKFTIYNSVTGIQPSDNAIFHNGDDSVAVNLSSGDTVECIFTNEKTQCGDGIVDFGEDCERPNSHGCDASCHFLGAIKIAKVASSTEEMSFEFDASYYPDNFHLSNGDSNISGFLPTKKSYTVKEINLSDDWILSDIDCKCYQVDITGREINRTGPCKSSATKDLSSNQVSINLLGNDLIKCTFINSFAQCQDSSCAVCGNAILEQGEQCDNGSANSDSGACTLLCKIPFCGDGLVQPNEECDSGSPNGSATCSNLCKLKVPPNPSECGNGLLEGFEECDDGNLSEGDGCNLQCKIEKCGDGKINNAVGGIATEQCDDGALNGSHSSSCDDYCRLVEGPFAGCVHRDRYWKTHASEWPVANLTLGGVNYSQTELLALLKTHIGGDTSLRLARQLIATLLNQAKGASSTPEVDSAINAANSLLAFFSGKLPFAVTVNSPEGREMKIIARLLRHYNQGIVGPGRCHDRNKYSDDSSDSEDEDFDDDSSSSSTSTPQIQALNSAVLNSNTQPAGPVASGGCASLRSGGALGSAAEMVLLLLTLAGIRFRRIFRF